jgi:hypothetical protein
VIIQAWFQYVLDVVVTQEACLLFLAEERTMFASQKKNMISYKQPIKFCKA